MSPNFRSEFLFVKEWDVLKILSILQDFMTSFYFCVIHSGCLLHKDMVEQFWMIIVTLNMNQVVGYSFFKHLLIALYFNPYHKTHGVLKMASLVFFSLLFIFLFSLSSFFKKLG